MNQKQIKELLENEEMEVNESEYLKQLIEMEQQNKLSGLTFGEAIEDMKKGKAVSRSGWNGKGMLIYIVNGNVAVNNKQYVGTDEGETSTDITGPIEGISSKLFNLGDYGTVTRLPHINMKAATGSTVTGWLASETDILSEDWGIVNN